MKWLERNRMKLVLIGIAARMVFGGGSAKADFTFGEPSNLGPTVNSPQSDVPCFVSVGGLELYFFSERPGGLGNSDIWVTTRETIDNGWSTPVNLGSPVNSSYPDTYAMISPDGLELYFSSERPGGLGLGDIWVTRRESKDDTWGVPVNLGPTVNSSQHDYGAFMSSDSLELYFNSMRVGAHDIYVMRRTTKDDDWGPPINLGPLVNSLSHDIAPNLSTDGLYLFFSDHPSYGFSAIPLRSGGFGGADIWVTSRPSTSDEWSVPVNLGLMINTSADDCVPNISPDGSMLYFASNRLGGYGGQDGDIWQAPILPIVDFNGDGIVDSADMCIMVDHWGEHYYLCDIGPMPWGDGVIDVEDLQVLAEHLFEEVYDPTLIAHWPLDETQGAIAYDSVAENDGTLIGDPVWQPDDGMVGGAILLNGINDYISTEFVLNPADSVFSVVGWIKGGAAGQVILSEANGANWLCTDSIKGNLMTELKMDLGRFKGDPLSSEVIINDGNWHRIGFVWDGSCRHLYVDGVKVANDDEPLSGLNDAYGGLYIGAGKNLYTNSFFSGLIDDVRIYNRVVVQ